MALSELEMNRKERMKFVVFWADYVRTHPDKVWSRQQAVLINSFMANARSIKPKQYLDYLQKKGEKISDDILNRFKNK